MNHESRFEDTITEDAGELGGAIDEPGDGSLLGETSLRLDERQLRQLLDFVNLELDECCREMGRGTDGLTVSGSWLDRRRLNQLWYEGDLAWREGDVYLGGVFNDSNFTRGDGKRYVRHMAAKVTDDLFGTTPFFAAMKKDNGNASPRASLVKAIEDLAQDGVEKSNVAEILREAVELALTRNEAVVKLRNVFEATSYLGPAEVLVDANGEPVRTPAKGLYIFKNDDLLPAPGQEGVLALEKDASFMASEAEAQSFRYEYFEELPQVQVRREGLEARVLDPRDFICRLKVNDIHEAVLNAHFYDESPAVLKQAYGGMAVSSGYFSAPESGEKSPITSQGEMHSEGRSQEWVQVAEVYVRFDADEDGREEEIVLIMDRQRDGGAALFYDYLHKHMKRRPFEVLHGLRKVPSRWYGLGIYSDKFDQLVFIDKTFNRINLKNSKTCTITAVRREAIEEWSDMKVPISFGGDEVLTLNSRWGAERGEWLEQKRLVEVSNEEVEVMQTMLQAMDQEFGYISAADASATGLNQSRTATGIASIERSGNNIVKAVERVQMRGITAVLEQAVDLILENMDVQRLALSKSAELLTLNRDEIRDVPRNVRLLLTRSRSSELLETNAQATQKANEYFDMLEARPRRAKAMRAMYLAQLKALEVQDADEILPEVTDEAIAAWEQGQQAAGKEQAAAGPRESISIPYRELQPSEKAQALQRIGITPEGDGVAMPPGMVPSADGSEAVEMADMPVAAAPEAGEVAV